jgi:hypothetical protein
MNLELKNIKFFEAGSQETNCFTADLYVDGNKIAYVNNDGHGGCTNYSTYKGDKRPVLLAAELYCKGLAPHVYAPVAGMDDEFSVPMTLEVMIDSLFEAWLKDYTERKFLQTIKRKFVTSVVIGNTKEFIYISWKNVTIAQMLAVPNGRAAILKALTKAVADGKVNATNRVLNDNIPADLLAEAGANI